MPSLAWASSSSADGPSSLGALTTLVSTSGGRAQRRIAASRSMHASYRQVTQISRSLSSRAQRSVACAWHSAASRVTAWATGASGCPRGPDTLRSPCTAAHRSSSAPATAGSERAMRKWGSAQLTQHNNALPSKRMSGKCITH